MAKRKQSPAKQLAKLGMHLAGKLAAKSKKHQVILLDAFLRGWPIDVQISVEPPQEYLRALELEAARAAEQKYLEGLTVDQRLKLASEMAKKGYGPMEQGEEPMNWLMDRRSGSDETNRIESARLDAQIVAKQAEIDEIAVEPVSDESFQKVTAETEVDLTFAERLKARSDREASVVVPFSQIEGDLDNEPETVATATEINPVVGHIKPVCDLVCPEGQSPEYQEPTNDEDGYWNCVAVKGPTV